LNNFPINNQISKKRSKSFQRFLQIVSNLSRSFLATFFVILINYILLQHKSSSILTTYVYSISIINLFFAIINWGGKDYITKAYTKEPFAVKELTAKLFGSKLLMSFIMIPFVFFLPTSLTVKFFIATYLIVKTFNQVYESLIVLQKKYHLSLAFDLFFYVVLLVVICVDGNKDNSSIFLTEVLFLEVLRNAFYAFLFWRETAFTLNFTKCLQVIKASSIFFYIAIAGFLCSKADLYTIGLLLGKQSMSIYYIITNLVAFCLIAYASINGTFVSVILRYNQKNFEKFTRFSIYTGLIFSFFSALAVYTICRYYYGITISLWFGILVWFNVFGFTRVLMQMYRYTRFEKQNLVLRCLIVAGLANVLLSYFLTPSMGQTGAFTANTISVYINLFALQMAYKKNTN
jgi:O-antigen/teichoic acid export membrane protein